MGKQQKHPEKGEKKTGGRRGGGKGKMVAGIVGLGVVAIIITGVIWAVLNPVPAVVPVDYTTRINNLNSYDGENVTEAINSIYGLDATGLTEAEILAKTITDFTLLGTNTSGESFEYDPALRYIVASAASGFNTYWWVPDMGVENDLEMVPIGTSVNLIAMANDNFSTNLKDNAVANTTQTDWKVLLQTEDADSINDSVGWEPYLNFTDSTWTLTDFDAPVYDQYVLFDISFVKADGADNGTAINANVSWITEITGLTVDVDYTIKNSTSHLFIEIFLPVLGLDIFDLVFDGIGVDFNVRAITANYGNPTTKTLLGTL